MLVPQEKNLSLPEPLHDFLATQIARHLDPYIDGDIATAEDVTDNTPMYTRLKEKYQAAHGRELPCPAEVVLAMYVRHGVCKCDAYQCFTDLVMGQGRLPEGGDKNQKHCKALGKALAAAITKDFGKENAKIQGVQISAQARPALRLTSLTIALLALTPFFWLARSLILLACTPHRR